MFEQSFNQSHQSIKTRKMKRNWEKKGKWKRIKKRTGGGKKRKKKKRREKEVIAVERVTEVGSFFTFFFHLNWKSNVVLEKNKLWMKRKIKK